MIGVFNPFPSISEEDIFKVDSGKYSMVAVQVICGIILLLVLFISYFKNSTSKQSVRYHYLGVVALSMLATLNGYLLYWIFTGQPHLLFSILLSSEVTHTASMLITSLIVISKAG